MRFLNAHLALLAFYAIPQYLAATVDLTSANRRPPAHGLPDWSKVGYEQGNQPLPDDSQVGNIVTAQQLASQYGVIPNDGVDDTDGLARAISDQHNVGGPGKFVLIQLPAGVLNLKYTIYVDANYLILRGAGNDPDNGGTVLEFRPDENTVYDALEQPGGDQWDEDGMSTSWSYDETDPASQSGIRHVTGSATSGWLWPGRSMFRVGTKDVAAKFFTPRDLAADNRKDIFYGTANYHWRIDSKVKGYMADQTKDVAGFMGTNKVYYDAINTTYAWEVGQDCWIGAPVRYVDYKAWQVQNQSYYRNEYLYQDWFTVTSVGMDDDGHYLLLDHALRFDVYTSSVADGSPEMEDSVTVAKVMPIEVPVHHVGIENLYITQPMEGMDPNDAVHNYGNLAPAYAMHGIVFRYARDSWVRNIRTFMTGSHPIATEAARYLQIQDNYFDGAWNKGKGGNGYLRGSRVWDSLYFNNTLRNVRHFTFQWCAMGNVALMNNMTNDMNMHGGWEGYNLLELNLVTVPYSHRPGSCTAHCGGEGGSEETGTWAPIYWSTGNKASKWSGATGPRSVFYRNYMLKEFQPNAGQTDFLPYFNRDGSLSDIVWEFGWDRGGNEGSRYQHLSLDGGKTMLDDWQGHEQTLFHVSPAVGVNGATTDQYTSLFLRDLTGADGVPSFSNISGQAYCLGKTVPKVVGFYLGSAASRSCLPWAPDATDVTAYTHILYAYASLAADGTVSLSADQKTQVSTLVAQKQYNPNLRIYVAVGGWGLGADPTALLTIATSGAARTKLGTTARTLLTSIKADGLDLEWAPCVGTKCISASQFGTIASAVKVGLGSLELSLTTPNNFWSLSGVNTITANFTRDVEFINLLTHGGTDPTPNDQDAILDAVSRAGKAGMAPNFMLMGIPFYGRSTSGATSSCIGSGDLGQGTYPFFAVQSLYSSDGFYAQETLQEIYLDPDTGVSGGQLSDGSIVYSDTPYSVSKKARLSQDNCMGGISVFSVDQDDDASTMTQSIYWPGGLSPTAEEITDSLDISALDSQGNLRTDAWDSFTSQVANSFPYIGAVGTYRVIVLGALKMQTQVANRLRLFLTEPELSIDNFNVYVTWESKALDYTIANITGLGGDYWSCENPFGQSITCPGWFDFDSVFPSPSDTRWDSVKWTLKDGDGFREFLMNGTGLDTKDLVSGSFFVHRDLETCNVGPTQNPCPPASPGCQQRRANVTQTLKKRIDGDPYDPPDNCRTSWDGIFVAPKDYFVNPVDMINSYVDTSDNIASYYRLLAVEDDQSVTVLADLLERTLTTVSLGNETIGNLKAYMDEVHFDQALQQVFDQAHARASVGEVVSTILLGVLGFIPGVGEIADLFLGGVDAFGIFSKFVDAATLTGTLAKDSRILRLFGRGGLATEADITAAAEDVELGLSDTSLATRGSLGKSVDTVTDKIAQCGTSDLGSLALDGLSLGSSLLDPSDAVTLTTLERRKKPIPQPCLFKVTSTAQLRGKNYAERCSKPGDGLLDVPDDPANPTSVSQITFKNCKEGPYAKDCTCDHLIEILEFIDIFRKKITDAGELDALCEAMDAAGIADSTEEMSNLINGLDSQKKPLEDGRQNLRPLFGTDTVFKPAGVKAGVFGFSAGTVVTPRTLKNEFRNDMSLMYDVLNKYMVESTPVRNAVADATDDILEGWHGKLQGNDAALSSFEKIWKPVSDGDPDRRRAFRRQTDSALTKFFVNIKKISAPKSGTPTAPKDPTSRNTPKKKELAGASAEEVDCKKSKAPVAGPSTGSRRRRALSLEL